MGKLEKLVVLTVLFAAAIVLAISLNRGSGMVDASDPLSEAQELLDREGATAPSDLDSAIRDEARALEAAPSLLLHAGAERIEAESDGERTSGGREGEGSELAAAGLQSSSEATLSLEPRSDPTQPILVDLRGLRPSFLDDYMTYTVAEGDTWSALAQRFYQDGRYTRNLHLANEDLAELTPGKQILVPVYDFIAAEAGLQAGDESVATAMRDATAQETTAQGSARPLEYEVRDGDTLSDISLAVFGTATRWKEILEANRDLLQRPESLQVGMKLKIPAGGELPLAGPEAKKPEARRATTRSSEKPATKKKKVL